MNKLEDLQRYGTRHDYPYMGPWPTGEWVRFEDVQQLLGAGPCWTRERAASESGLDRNEDKD